jgi:DNA segregation ATPase FtsK/SpoIIIE, S-DNA-T family
LRANANIIKRTLDSFGIPVEMGEISIGPKVTRYTLKPAEGIKLSRITALNQDLSLALAAHPIRIEAPIPGKSLVGIEVPNKSAAIVRLGSLMAFPDFNNSGPLGFILGRDVSGEPIVADIAKMPHILIAGSTGSGKSVAIHTLITSLIYKNSPETLRFVMIDPKRVELTIYNDIPHLVAPVITEGKKALGVFRWAIDEMENRYEKLQGAGARDIGSYNKSNPEETLPYIVIVVDELADLMAAYGRDIESSIVRLAQMARATGIHLVLSTQRPSVEVITGLIKANITARMALQVASQVDSRTILDASGAEKLLGGGDMLFISSELSKPKRIQGAYISEEELHKVTDFIRDNNEGPASMNHEEEDEDKNPTLADKFETKKENSSGEINFEEFTKGEEEDDMYDEAVEVVRQAQKASASLLQRRLAIGYARAARLLDMMEENGIVGPGEGAKPREVYIEKNPEL